MEDRKKEQRKEEIKNKLEEAKKAYRNEAKMNKIEGGFDRLLALNKGGDGKID